MRLFTQLIRPLLGLAASATLLSLATPALADGFHYQIQAATKLVSNSAGQLNAVDMVWTYDPELAAILLEDEDLSEANKAATLKQRANDILVDLSKLGYFSQLTVDGQALSFSEVQDYTMVLNPDQSMSLSFHVPLKAPVIVAGKKVSLSLADPDGVATLFYKNPSDASLDEHLAKTCSTPSLSKITNSMPNDHKVDVPTAQTECK
ncbi:DUF1007 family protein [uncultured Thiothrix sp.]|uniref:DUF1007 family protein n=1 Tax=uncultured Thiothrix sp. TaxID=223185 RepID=UPI002613BED2|nr:DUF1007 family protein [uncultured Thiothrix sp.]